MNPKKTRSVFVIRRTSLAPSNRGGHDLQPCVAGDACYLVEFDTCSTPRYKLLFHKRDADGGKHYSSLSSARRAFRAESVRDAMANPGLYQVEVVEVVFLITRPATNGGWVPIDEKVVWPNTKTALDRMAEAI